MILITITCNTVSGHGQVKLKEVPGKWVPELLPEVWQAQPGLWADLPELPALFPELQEEEAFF